ncbi:U1 small nuclear ribonucleoprotein 70 kDa [Impatiens glandulifera]|uniref:U1 small nuclear ribonucleoprotein 70 kDa n=1 Tax=Impatiens glandulifera TaxID=253017 RepID=UPI001FB192FB|nr:U1 small nuclear ribonucleoprotein 70 kDa [Impatiens glandulifera]
MTIDDENSVYVGGLPYDATEETVRRTFSIYGHVIAVKIINDRGVGGRCYGFVTFTNPRSAIDSIKDMNGRTIGGRIVRVNDVKTRGGRSNFGRENIPRNGVRENWDRDRDRNGRDRDYSRERDRFKDHSEDRSQSDDHGREQRGYDDRDDHVRKRDEYEIRDDRVGKRDDYEHRDGIRVQDRGLDNKEPAIDRKRDREWESSNEFGRVQDEEIDRNGNDRHHSLKKTNGSQTNERRDRELRSVTSDEDNDEEISKQLHVSNQQLEELQKQISEMEDLVEEKQQLVIKLHEKSQKLENSLTTTKKASSHRQALLTKLHRYYLLVKENRERLKTSEQELQSLIESTRIEVDVGIDAAN